MFEGRNINKKHKGIKKGSSGQGFENFSDRINSLINFDTFKKTLADFEEVSRLTVLNGEMKKQKKKKTKKKRKTVVKSTFPQINDKRFYFADGITSLPLSHPHL